MNEAESIFNDSLIWLPSTFPATSTVLNPPHFVQGDGRLKGCYMSNYHTLSISLLLMVSYVVYTLKVNWENSSDLLAFSF